MPGSDVAANVRAELARRLIPHSEIANVLSMTPQAISRRLRGEVPFRDSELSAVAKHLDIDVSALFAKVDAA